MHGYRPQVDSTPLLGINRFQPKVALWHIRDVR